VRAPGELEVLAERVALDPSPASSSARVVDGVAVGERVDQPGLHRLGAEVGATVDERAHLLRRLAPGGGDPFEQLRVPGVGDAPHRLLVRRGELLLGEDVHRVLVLVALVHARHDPELLEVPARNGDSMITPVRFTSPEGWRWISSKAVAR
jgi:hypothetical protein